MKTGVKLSINGYDFNAYSVVEDGDYIIYTYIDIPGNLIGLPDGFYTIEVKEKENVDAN